MRTLKRLLVVCECFAVIVNAGRAVTYLSAADFEVYEDGVRQQLNSFRLVVREPAGSNTAAGQASDRECG